MAHIFKKKNGLSNEYLIISVFVDVNRFGNDDDRDGFNEALNRLREVT